MTDDVSGERFRDLVVLLEQMLEELRRMTEQLDALSTKLDRTNDTLAELNRSQWAG